MKYLLNVDWLEFHGSTSIHLNNFLSNGIYKFSSGVNLQKITNYKYQMNNYPYCFQIFNNSGTIGKLYTKAIDLSYSSGFNMVLRIDNFILYHPDLQSILKKLVDTLEIVRMKCKRLDICYDTDIDVLAKFKTLFSDTSFKFRYRGKIKVNGTGATDEELTIGSLNSRRRSIMIYNKTKEIINSHKNYITKIHRNFFGFKSIYRVELRIMKNTLELKNIDVLELGNSAYVESIFNTYFDRLITFKNVRTNKVLEFITLNQSGSKLNRIKISKTGGKSLNVIKSIVNSMDEESRTKQFRGQIKDWNGIRDSLLKKYELEEWYLVKKKGGRQ